LAGHRGDIDHHYLLDDLTGQCRCQKLGRIQDHVLHRDPQNRGRQRDRRCIPRRRAKINRGRSQVRQIVRRKAAQRPWNGHRSARRKRRCIRRAHRVRVEGIAGERVQVDRGALRQQRIPVWDIRHAGHALFATGILRRNMNPDARLYMQRAPGHRVNDLLQVRQAEQLDIVHYVAAVRDR